MPTSAQKNVSKQVLAATVRYIALKRLQQLKEVAKAVRKEKKRNLRRRNDRRPIYTNPNYASQKINNLLRGHPENFRIETRLTIVQFELLAAWLHAGRPTIK